MKTKKLLIALCGMLISLSAFSQQIGGGIATNITSMDQALPSGMYFSKINTLYNGDFLISVKQATHSLQISVDKGLYLVGGRAYNRMYYRVMSNSATQPVEWVGVASTRGNTFTDDQIINAKLGIKNINPSYDLDVTGTGRFTGNVTMSAKVGIKTTNPTYDLDVNGVIRGKEVRVESGWADFVFDKDYKLPELNEVKAHIEKHKQLPGIPSAEEVKQNGIGLSEATTLLLQKVEELTLYVIQQNEQMKKQNEINEMLKNEIKELKKQK